MFFTNQRGKTQSISYKRSSKISKPKVIMNDFQVDCGYPQDIFAANNSRLHHNFIQKNKKNLKNFFKERIPQNQLQQRLQRAQHMHFDSQRIVEIKAQQIQLKSQTKIILDNSLLSSSNTNKSINFKKIEKVDQIFSLNDKTLEFKNKFQSLPRNRLYTYNKDNHLRGTQCFLEKRSKIPKKQAYEKVFGLNKTFQYNSMPQTPKGRRGENVVKSNDKRNKTFSSHMRPKQKQQNLCNLLRKMDDFKNKFKAVKIDYNDDPISQSLPICVPPSHQLSSTINNSDQKSRVLGMVKNIRQYYRQGAILQNRQRLLCFQDLQKLDSKFYHNLTSHKKGRMEKRLIELYRHSLPQTNTEIIRRGIVRHQDPELNHHLAVVDGREKQEDERLEAFSVTDDEEEETVRKEAVGKRERLGINERFRRLGIHLAKAYLQSKFYQVSPACFYPAFWQHRQPYQMQGSYAFFKAIKLNDIECIKSFINVNIKYLYEEDVNRRTPLMYACLHDHCEIVRYFLGLGCNVDKVCLKKKTALLYALQNHNLEICELLLQYGASPWSETSCPYSKILKQINDSSFQVLFSNAKKIFLGVRLQVGGRKRQQFWNKNKNKITFREKIDF